MCVCVCVPKRALSLRKRSRFNTLLVSSRERESEREREALGFEGVEQLSPPRGKRRRVEEGTRDQEWGGPETVMHPEAQDKHLSRGAER